MMPPPAVPEVVVNPDRWNVLPSCSDHIWMPNDNFPAKLQLLSWHAPPKVHLKPSQSGGAASAADTPAEPKQLSKLQRKRHRQKARESVAGKADRLYDTWVYRYHACLRWCASSFIQYGNGYMGSGSPMWELPEVGFLREHGVMCVFESQPRRPVVAAVAPSGETAGANIARITSKESEQEKAEVLELTRTKVVVGQEIDGLIGPRILEHIAFKATQRGEELLRIHVCSQADYPSGINLVAIFGEPGSALFSMGAETRILRGASLDFMYDHPKIDNNNVRDEIELRVREVHHRCTTANWLMVFRCWPMGRPEPLAILGMLAPCLPGCAENTTWVYTVAPALRWYSMMKSDYQTRKEFTVYGKAIITTVLTELAKRGGYTCDRPSGSSYVYHYKDNVLGQIYEMFKDDWEHQHNDPSTIGVGFSPAKMHELWGGDPVKKQAPRMLETAAVYLFVLGHYSALCDMCNLLWLLNMSCHDTVEQYDPSFFGDAAGAPVRVHPHGRFNHRPSSVIMYFEASKYELPFQADPDNSAHGLEASGYQLAYEVSDWLRSHLEHNEPFLSPEEMSVLQDYELPVDASAIPREQLLNSVFQYNVKLQEPTQRSREVRTQLNRTLALYKVINRRCTYTPVDPMPVELLTRAGEVFGKSEPATFMQDGDLKGTIDWSNRPVRYIDGSNVVGLEAKAKALGKPGMVSGPSGKLTMVSVDSEGKLHPDDVVRYKNEVAQQHSLLQQRHAESEQKALDAYRAQMGAPSRHAGKAAGSSGLQEPTPIRAPDTIHWLRRNWERPVAPATAVIPPPAPPLTPAMVADAASAASAPSDAGSLSRFAPHKTDEDIAASYAASFAATDSDIVIGLDTPAASVFTAAGGAEVGETGSGELVMPSGVPLTTRDAADDITADYGDDDNTVSVVIDDKEVLPSILLT